MNVFLAKRRCYPLCVRDGDPHGRRHFSGSVAGAGRNGVPGESPMRVALQYSPTRRDDFVKCDSAGARPTDLLVSSGYEQGLFGMEGRGLYAGGNVGGVYAQVAQNGGWSYGGSANVVGYTKVGKYNRISVFNNLFGMEWMKMSADAAFFAKNDNDPENLFIQEAAQSLDDDRNDVYTVVSHSEFVDGQGLLYTTSGDVLTADMFAENMKSEYNYKGEKTIILYACEAGKGGKQSFAQQLANRLPGVTVIAATAPIRVFRLGFFNGSATMHRDLNSGVINNGQWQSFKSDGR